MISNQLRKRIPTDTPDNTAVEYEPGIEKRLEDIVNFRSLQIILL